MNKKFFTFLYVILIISVICFMIWMVMWLKSMSASCISDPLGFYAEHNSLDEKCDLDHSHYSITCTPNNFNEVIFGDADLNIKINP